MPWVRIDENAMDHPKIGGLPDGAFRLWVQGLAYCQKYLTDGAIGSVALRGLRAYSPKRRADIVAAGLWVDGDNGGVHVHDFLDWNDGREHVLAARKSARERIQRLRGKQRSNASGNGERTALPRENRSGGVVCSLSSGSSLEGGPGETALSVRAGNFCEWYAETHRRLFEVGYIGNPGKDYEAACRLCETLTDQDIRDAATVWFGADDDFAKNGTRTIPKFASRATGYLEKLKARGIA